MPKFLTQATYTAEGLKGLMRDKASGRREAVIKALASLGCKLDGFYFTFGYSDVMLVIDAPDNATAAALSLAVSATGVVRTSTTPLLTVEEVDKAIAKSVDYRPPGT